MITRGEDETSKKCVAAALALAVAHILTLLGTKYQVYSPDRFQFDRALLVNYAVLLSPIAIPFAVRKVCIAVGFLAVPVLTFFVWRMYYVWQFHWFGINSMARQKGDELSFYLMIFAMYSVPALLFILLIRLIEGYQRLRKE